MAGASIDDLLRAADKGAPIGTTQRYFKASAPPATATPASPPAAQPAAAPSGESEKEMIDRILGRKKQSMSDVGEGVRAGDQFAMAEPGGAEATPTTRTYTLERDGKTATIESPRDLSPQELSSLAAQHFGAPRATPEPEGALQHVGRIVREEAGRVPGRIKSDVEGIVNTAKNPKMSTVLPLTLGPGAGVVSRLGSIAAGKILDEPKGSFSENLATAGKAAAAGAVTEAGAKYLPKVKIPFVGKLAEMAEKAGRNPQAAFDSIAARLPNARILVPALDPARKLSFAEIGKAISKLSGDAREQAIAEVKNILNGIDRQMLAGGPPPGAGDLFAQRAGTAPVTRGQHFAKEAVPALQSPFGRIAADVAAQQEASPGIPAGIVPPMLAAQYGGGLAGLARRWVTH